MTDYLVEPEVAGGFGDDTEIDHSTTPITVTRLHYEIETWLGSELLESYPVFIATDNFVETVTTAGLTGFTTDAVEVTISEQGREYMAEARGITSFPHFVWFKPVGARGADDFAQDEKARLVVSARALDVIRPMLGDDVEITEVD